jgi:hypothetical protein
MITEDVNLSSIIISNKPDPCIFCLEDEPTPICYQGNCKCHPPIHNACITVWYNLKPNTCPICLKGDWQNVNLIIIVEPAITRKIVLIFCCLCCLSLCFSPFIILGIVYARYPIYISNRTNINSTLQY